MDNMKNININSIFCNNDKEKKVENGTLNIDSLVNNNSFNVLNDEYIVKKIKNSKNKEKQKLNDLFESKYKDCLLRINNSIDLNKEELIFKVDDIYFGYNNYKSSECINFINEKLIKKKFKTQILSKNEIFINWSMV
jgi:hypothetical protein